MKRIADSDSIVPAQGDGTGINIKEELKLQNEREAIEFFAIAKSRLRDVNHWAHFAGDLLADFELKDANGESKNHFVEKGDYFKIDIPGPGAKTGNGYDWVQVEEVKDESDDISNHFSFRVRPASNPLNSQSDIAHFYSDDSSSTFSVNRFKNCVSVEIWDRNLKPNKHTKSKLDKVRDILIGVMGILAFSKLQWAHLAKGILKECCSKTN